MENENNILIIIITIIIGITVGTLFGYLLFKEYKYKGPDSNIIVTKIYEDNNGRKYKWIPKICICPIDLSMNKLKNINYKDNEH